MRGVGLPNVVFRPGCLGGAEGTQGISAGILRVFFVLADASLAIRPLTEYFATLPTFKGDWQSSPCQ